MHILYLLSYPSCLRFSTQALKSTNLSTRSCAASFDFLFFICRVFWIYIRCNYPCRWPEIIDNPAMFNKSFIAAIMSPDFWMVNLHFFSKKLGSDITILITLVTENLLPIKMFTVVSSHCDYFNSLWHSCTQSEVNSGPPCMYAPSIQQHNSKRNSRSFSSDQHWCAARFYLFLVACLLWYTLPYIGWYTTVSCTLYYYTVS